MPPLPRAEIVCCKAYSAVVGIIVCAHLRDRYSISVREAQAFLRRCSALRGAICRVCVRCVLMPLLRNGVSSAARPGQGRHLSRFVHGACLRLLSRISLLALRSLCHCSSSWGLLPMKDHGFPKPKIRQAEVLHSGHCSVDLSCGAMPPNNWWTVELRCTSPSLRSAAIVCKASLNSSSRKLAAFMLQKHAAAQARQAPRNCNDVTSQPW